MKTALITGGSSGFGLEFARQLAAQKFNLILVARNVEQLQAAADELHQQFGVATDILAGDLSDETFVADVVRKIHTTKDLAVLINDAGFGLHESLLDDSPEATAKQRAAFRVMAQNVLELSAAAAQTMMAQKTKGQIINIASANAWIYTGNYSALKRWVVSYTEGLAIELAGSGVTTTAVCPGWSHTNFHKNVNLPEPNVPEWMFVKPAAVVSEGLKASRKGQIICIPTARWKFMLWVAEHFPRTIARSFTRRYMAGRHDNAQQ